MKEYDAVAAVGLMAIILFFIMLIVGIIHDDGSTSECSRACLGAGTHMSHWSKNECVCAETDAVAP